MAGSWNILAIGLANMRNKPAKMKANAICIFFEVLIIKPVSVLLPKGTTALTPVCAKASSSFGTEYVNVFLNGRGKTISANIILLVYKMGPAL